MSVSTQKKYPMLPPSGVKYTVGLLASKDNYNHKLMNIPHVWEKTRGEKTKVAILDTGVPRHDDLSPLGGCSAWGIESGDRDRNGHATHVGGIIAALSNGGIGVDGIAPETGDYYIKVLDDNGSGSIDTLVDGIRKAVDSYGVDIINMSLGLPASAPLSRELEAACEYANSNGVTVFAATGNEATRLGQPAIYDSVVAVGAVDRRKKKARFSNRGKGVDFVAGGVDVYSTHLDNSYAALSGTSMACPAVAAAGLLILSKHALRGENLSPAELIDHIERIAFKSRGQDCEELYGNGIPIFGGDKSSGQVTKSTYRWWAPWTW